MSATASAIFVSRLKGLPILDGSGDQLGKVRDVVVQNRAHGRPPRVKGLVLELLARRRVFLPMERVHRIDAQQIVIAGVIHAGRFERRDQELLVVEQLFDKRVTRRDGTPSTIFDVAIVQARTRDWEVVEVALREVSIRRPFGLSRGHVVVVDWDEVPDFFIKTGQETEQLVAQLSEMKPADAARELHDMSPDRRAEVVEALDDEVLAEALEELPESDQVRVISQLEPERAADILEEMDPDDAADLIAELEPDLAEALLQRMEPEDADDVRTLLTYDAATAGGLMTPEPVILAPDATVADCLAHLRHEEITPALAALAFICRPPLETPTGRYLGAVHIQRLLREPPSLLAAGLVDSSIAPLEPASTIAQVSRYFATYDLVCAPVVDDSNRLVGAVTVDDVLDHILPNDWRGVQLAGREEVTDAKP